MQEDDQLALAAQMANVMARFEERCRRVEHQQSLLAEQLPAMIEEKIDRWLQSCAGQIENTVRDGFSPPVAEFRRSVQGVTAEATKTARGLDVIRGDFALQRRWVLWGFGITLIGCLASLVTTYELVDGFYQARYDALRSQVIYLDAVNRADVAPCGDGRLCARIDDNAPRVGDKKQFRLIELRP
ncbi:MAG: hypothetical protein ACRYG8_11920 [Janthinobacterium lividum]